MHCLVAISEQQIQQGNYEDALTNALTGVSIVEELDFDEYVAPGFILFVAYIHLAIAHFFTDNLEEAEDVAPRLYGYLSTIWNGVWRGAHHCCVGAYCDSNRRL